ncbi:S1C family serine protease [Streptomyces sp. NBC_00347]|uniref:S1C family serine protease n=1 Tax=Streptomyces sp. NBC_00347 TaxID=2975721 RepID=UPI002257F765|nr:trypsin-like peptidase domain-containing protein [Streptomyces sp. NBC_00347]MCX5122666.1 trypsin-like peptidase domain-containing protein [Streptomyces sp. NBC_00347]
MSDSQQTDPAADPVPAPLPRWWSRPAEPVGAHEGSVPPPRAAEHAAPDTAPDPAPAPVTAPAPVPQWWSRPAQPVAGHEGSVPPPRTAPEPVADPDADPEPRYDPWGVRPLQAVDHGKAGSRRFRLRQGIVLGLGAALLAGGIGGYAGVLAERQAGTRLELPQAAPADGGRAPDSVAGIAATALPGVVTLHVNAAEGSSTGTGFVLDGQGHILTNNHVVHGARTITVTFSTGESVAAELVGGDTGYDLAVVKVDGVRGLRPLALGNSENVKVGDPVVAIGAPFDLSNTVTAGIISATGRPITAGGDKGDGSDVSYVDALQTDAPINPGNSGGPLLDARAQVIGINSAIRGGDGKDSSGQQRGSIGLGFAIPVNQGKRVAEELIRTGRATHPVIGVTLDMDYSGDGARVGEKGEGGKPAVTAGGPGARAGIRPGDVITKVDGVRVHGGDELVIKIRAHRPGDRLTLTVLREGRERTLEVVLGSANGS